MPCTTIVSSLLGPDGVMAIMVGVLGAIESCTYARGDEQVLFPAASVARTEIVVVPLRVAPMVMPLASWAPVPVSVAPVVHVLLWNTVIAALVSVVPVSSGVVSLLGLAGVSCRLVMLGGVESSTYVSGAEHADVLPAASVAVAANCVVASSVTVRPMPGLAKLAAAVVVLAPVQSLVA